MDASFYLNFYKKAEKVKYELISFLINAKKDGKKVVGYGAAAKGNTLLNYAGIRDDLISYIVDRNPAKQEKFMPGSRIPIVSEDFLKKDRPDYILILPWNLKDELKEQLNYARNWGAKILVALPNLNFI